MAEFLNKIIPNVMARTDIFWESFRDTFIMVGWAGGISFMIGIILGITLIVTRPSGIVPNQVIYQVIDKIVNFFRSIPFIILLVGLVPLSRAIMGTGIGVKGAIVPLIFGCAPFFTRQMETAMSDVNPGYYLERISERKHRRHRQRNYYYNHQPDWTDSYGRSSRSRWTG